MLAKICAMVEGLSAGPAKLSVAFSHSSLLLAYRSVAGLRCVRVQELPATVATPPEAHPDTHTDRQRETHADTQRDTHRETQRETRRLQIVDVGGGRGDLALCVAQALPQCDVRALVI